MRYESDGTTVSKYVKVPLKLSGKEKIWYWLNERKDDQMLPMLSANINSVDFASERMGNKLHNIVKSVSPSENKIQRFINPVPYNIGFTLLMWTLHMNDADQILEQILPYFAPHVMMRINIPELGGSFDIKVVFQSCAPDTDNEMADEDYRVILWNMDFMVHAYLFQPIKETGVIKKIITKLYTSEDQWAKKGLYRDGSTETTFTSGSSGSESESIFIKATQVDGEWYDSAGDPYSEWEVFGN